MDEAVGGTTSKPARNRAAAQPRVPKQAVLVIHGMGEQKPLETLRAFVESVYQRDYSLRKRGDEQMKSDDPELLDDVNRVLIVPDDATGSAELRRISTPPNARGVRTDFFEFYWADIMEGTPLEQVMSWFRGIILRSPLALPRQPKIVIAWVALWVITIVFLLSALFVANPDLPVFDGPEKWIFSGFAAIRVWLGWAAIGLGVLLIVQRFSSGTPAAKVRLLLPVGLIVVGLVLLLISNKLADNPKLWAAALSVGMAALLNGLIAPYVGDVVRYVRATPLTVEKRAAVRKRGLELITALHARGEDGTPLYDRIMVVAHSLGCIIGYDLIQLYWEQQGPSHNRKWQPDAATGKALQEVDAFVGPTWPLGSGLTGQSGLELGAFRRKQNELFERLASSTLEWRISDFVTMGSPLSHADFLMFDGEEALERAFEDRLLSSSPPRPDRPGDSMLYKEDWGKAKARRHRGPYPHFAAPFAAVRWTNLYDEHWFPLIGDVVSGALAPFFGPGIEEHRIAMRWPNLPNFMNRLVTHTLYWTWSDKYQADLPENLRVLRDTLGLEGELTLRVAPKAVAPSDPPAGE